MKSRYFSLGLGLSFALGLQGCQIDLVADTGSGGDSGDCVATADCPEGLVCRAFACVSPSTTDPDGDLVPSADDNCPEVSNPTQVDSDGDGTIDVGPTGPRTALPKRVTTPDATQTGLLGRTEA